MVHTSGLLQIYRQTVWPTFNRPVWVSPDSPVTSVQQSVLGPRNRRGGCFVSNQLGFRNKLYQPSFQAVAKGSRAYSDNLVRGDSSGSFLACKTMVIQTKSNGSVSSPEASPAHKNMYSMSGRGSRTSKEFKVDSLCLESEWKKCLTELS